MLFFRSCECLMSFNFWWSSRTVVVHWWQLQLLLLFIWLHFIKLFPQRIQLNLKRKFSVEQDRKQRKTQRELLLASKLELSTLFVVGFLKAFSSLCMDGITIFTRMQYTSNESCTTSLEDWKFGAVLDLHDRRWRAKKDNPQIKNGVTEEMDDFVVIYVQKLNVCQFSSLSTRDMAAFGPFADF